MVPMILITGANGFIGSMMAWELNSQGIQDLILVDSVGLMERPKPLKHRKYQEFLLKDQIWNFLQTPDSKQITHVIHLGACSSTTETNWEFLKENNIVYSQRLFQWCTENKIHFIYASSAATYGDGHEGFDDRLEIARLKPLNLYGQSKQLFDLWAMEQSARGSQHQPPRWQGLKFFNVYGPNEEHKKEMSSVAYKAYHQIRQTGTMGLFKSYHLDYKDGEQKRDFVYVKDVTSWIYELMKHSAKSGIYNMGSGKARTWLDLTTAVFRAMGKTPQINWLSMPENLQGQYQYFTEATMGKWIEQGLTSPRWSLEAGVEDYVKNDLIPQSEMTVGTRD